MTTQTTEAQPTTVPWIPDELRNEALDLIRDFAAVAGDHEAAYQLLQDYCKPRKTEEAVAGLAVALLLTFTECITTPTGPGEYAETSFPTE